jgi:DNA-binding transcriptional LysR family regulator
MLSEIDLSRLDLNLLVLFEAVLAERHVGRTAARLNLSPSAVSHGLKRLRTLLNDPLFLRTPKGVTPTSRALELAAPLAEILALTRGLLTAAEPFDPETSKRSFVLGAPDGVSAVLLPQMLADLSRLAPSIDLRLRQLLPMAGESSPDRAWANALMEIEAREIDIAIVPTAEMPARFYRRRLYREDFVIVERAQGGKSSPMTLQRFCELKHVLVSTTGEPRGFVDEELGQQNLARRVALTVPNFFAALSVVADTDLVAAVPRMFAEREAGRFGFTIHRSPVALPNFELHAITSRAAMSDEGVAWLIDKLTKAAPRRSA